MKHFYVVCLWWHTVSIQSKTQHPKTEQMKETRSHCDYTLHYIKDVMEALHVFHISTDWRWRSVKVSVGVLGNISWLFLMLVCFIAVQLWVLLFSSAASPVRRPPWGLRVGPPVVKGSPGGGFITLVWRAESELVLRGAETHGVKGRKEARRKELPEELSVRRVLVLQLDWRPAAAC